MAKSSMVRVANNIVLLILILKKIQGKTILVKISKFKNILLNKQGIGVF